VTDAKAKDLAGKAAVGRLPLLETSEGCVFESNAIMRLVADGSALVGKTAFETAQINSWIDFCANEIEIPATCLTYPIIGWMENCPELTTKSGKDLKAAIMMLEEHLKFETFFVGRAITLADIAIACALVLPMKLVLDDKARKAFPCVTRWFTTCVNQPEFLKVVGPVTLVKKAVVCKAAPKKAAAPKEAAKAAPAPAPAAPPAKKKHPLESLPKSNFVLDSWKRQYSNAPGGDCFKAMPWFWENVDLEGYSLIRADYQYNNELTVGFQVSNLCGGFVQRCDEVRKYAFGTMQIIGEPKGGPMKIVCAWLIRGPPDMAKQALLDANPDAEYYDYKTYTINEETKKEIGEIWCAWETLEGMPIIDCKVFK